MIYYETSTKGEIQAHSTLEEAIQFAENSECMEISEIGGNWDDYIKCNLCGGWFTSYEINQHGRCSRCEYDFFNH